MSTLLELYNQVKQIYKRDDADTLQPKTAINYTYKAMLACIGHHKLQDRAYKNIVQGQYEVSLPEGILRIKHPIKIIDPLGGSEATGSYPLRFISKGEYDFWEPAPDLWATGNSTGIPWAYCLWKNSIYLTSIPDRNYTLEFALGGEPVDLLADTDESILSSVWDETIVAGSLSRLFVATKLYDDAKIWNGIYINGQENDQHTLIGGLKLLQRLDEDNTRGPIIIRNQPL
jgi:hypothetical protein